MVMDDYGWVYFIDRTGDTFRWRGENVSTVEVENVISSFLDSIEVCVYGVEVKDQEGRAGMASILSEDVDVKTLGNKLKLALPYYSRPVFLRLTKYIDHTGS
jgi:solute carrier family 27 (fatty acid transporter), member 1/4